MKSTILQAAAFATAALTIAAAPLAAQYKDMRLTIDVPFSFDAGGRMIERGKFSIRRGGSSGAIVMRGAVGSSTFAVVTQSTGNARVKPYLLFHKFGNTWFLREIQEPGSPIALVLPRSARQKEFERAAGPDSKPAEVAMLNAHVANAGGFE
ncbi:MAG: hypothetical protein IT162_05205 [Bryobacterales bacterium]|nr:hypothetical protein [Bryobacterales bacterium]